MKLFTAVALLLAATFAIPHAAHAEDFVITIHNNEFSPKEITIPANQKIKLTIKNLDGTPAEFESSDLNREKLVNPKSEIVFYVGPLDAGKYGFLNDFHRESTGSVIVK